MSDDRPEEFSPDERRLLDAWTIGDPLDVSERVLAEMKPKDRRSVWIGAGVVAGLIALMVGSFALRTTVRSASHLAEHRMTVPIGGRAVAVLEAGARVSYRAGAMIEVDQPEGDIFYRVEPGDPFVVRTPSGTVTVLGTCFRVEVKEMDAKASGAIGAVASALLTSTVWVTVYEGRVAASGEAGGVQTMVEAGESVELAVGRAPMKRERRDRIATRGEDAPLDGAAIDGRLPERERVLAEKNRDLEQKIELLAKALEETKEQSRDIPMYDIGPAELIKMAENCELRWDNSGLGPEPSTIATKDVEELELSEEERSVIDRHLAESHRRLIAEVRKTYAQVTGDESTGSLSGESMFAEIKDKTPEEELKRIFQQLARERAGLVAISKSSSPAERMFRMLTEEGDRLEREMAVDLGPESARKIRSLHQGWGGRHRSSYGCPGN